MRIAPPDDWLDALPQHRHALIVGAGPNGRPYHQHEPSNCLKIALNSAITIPWHWDIWMVFDANAQNFSWFQTKTNAHRIFGTDIGRKHDCEICFEYLPVIQTSRGLTHGILHGGASIAGCAIQLAYWMNCDHVTLLGIDQYGDLHFDGQVGAPKHHGRKWSTVKPLEMIISLVTADGVKVDSISKTAISVPLVKLW